MIDPNIYREAADFLAHNRETYDVGRCRGMCGAILEATRRASPEETSRHISLLEEYFKPHPPTYYWWRDITEETQAERFMCLHFMALIAEDL